MRNTRPRDPARSTRTHPFAATESSVSWCGSRGQPEVVLHRLAPVAAGPGEAVVDHPVLRPPQWFGRPRCCRRAADAAAASWSTGVWAGGSRERCRNPAPSSRPAARRYAPVRNILPMSSRTSPISQPITIRRAVARDAKRLTRLVCGSGAYKGEYAVAGYRVGSDCRILLPRVSATSQVQCGSGSRSRTRPQCRSACAGRLPGRAVSPRFHDRRIRGRRQETGRAPGGSHPSASATGSSRRARSGRRNARGSPDVLHDHGEQQVERPFHTARAS